MGQRSAAGASGFTPAYATDTTFSRGETSLLKRYCEDLATDSAVFHVWNTARARRVSIVPKREDRIDPRRASSGQQACRRRDRDQEERDPTGAVVPDAWVLIKPSSVASEAALAATLMVGGTRESGSYRASCLEPGRYDVMAPRIPPPGVVQTGNTPVIDRTPEVMNGLLKGSGGWQRVEVQSGVVSNVTVVQR